MSRRRTLASLAALAAVLALLARVPARADEKPAAHHEMHEKCAKACFDCSRECASCFHHCAHLVADGKKEHLKTLQTCQDCAAVCKAASCITARHGPFSDTICTSCAEACKRCGDACDQHKNDEMMKKCADECRRCEKACRDMLKHTGGAKEKE